MEYPYLVEVKARNIPLSFSPLLSITFFLAWKLKRDKMYDVKFDYTNKIAEIEIPEGISVIDDVLDGYRNYQTLSVALELDVFEEIAENGPSSARDIADAALVNRMFIRIILTALEDMGLLKSNQDKYFLTEPTETFLLQRNPLY